MLKKLMTLSVTLISISSLPSWAVRIVEPAVHEAEYRPAAIAAAITKRERKGFTKSAAKGLVGELAAVDKVQTELTLSGRQLVSIQSLFSEHRCEVSFRHSGNRGIDNVFVVQDPVTRWIDQRFSPVFHESKFRDNCRPRLSNTRTLSAQLSFNWLKANLEQAQRKTTRMCLRFPSQNSLTIKTCDECKYEFRSQVTWLQSQLMSGNFYRTVSVLCPDGRFKLYNVTED